MNWGLVGCGVIGERRALNLPEGVRLSHVFDPATDRAEKIANQVGAKVCASLDELVKSSVEAVVIAGVNSSLTPSAQALLSSGRHVLIEKPAARNYAELSTLKNPQGKQIKIGFNHRFHPAYKALRERLKARPEDPIMFIRAQYGNGARLGFDKEWRSNPVISGGGELLDQGVHVLDLASGLMNDLKVKTSFVKTHFWKMPVDDNAWAILEDKNGSTCSIHVSSTEWKNEFRFEVYTRFTKYQWLGLGRSYGPEKLLIYKMKPEMGPPDFEEINFPPEDLSWKLENQNFMDAILGKSKIDGGFEDGLKSLSLVQDIYEISSRLQEGRPHPEWMKS